jgi:toxin ParE1/3/4
MRVFVSARARADVLRVYSYLFDRNPIAADRVIERIERKLEQLSHFPFIGPERPGLAYGVRAAVVGTHLILYRVDDETGSSFASSMDVWTSMKNFADEKSIAP